MKRKNELIELIDAVSQIEVEICMSLRTIF